MKLIPCSTGRLRSLIYTTPAFSYNAVNARRLHYGEPRVHDPLRILFCGSDDFSTASLKALHKLYQDEGSNVIASIDVALRPAKPFGRGLKKYREVPIKSTAKELGLPVHELDTFRGWNLPRPNGEPINLIVAVSFGLFVPPRILNAVKYGGLNVHPSLLPDFRGPAPIHHFLLANERYTGVSVQTLDPKAFDHGAIIAQTRKPGFKVSKTCTVATLTERTRDLGAAMLVNALEEGKFLPPIRDEGWKGQETPTEKLRHAPKITPEDKRLDWQNWSRDVILQRQRIIGPLWTFVKLRHDGSEAVQKRLKIIHMSEVEMGDILEPGRATLDQLGDSTGVPFVGRMKINESPAVLVKASDGKLINLEQWTIEGEAPVNPVSTLSRKDLWCKVEAEVTTKVKKKNDTALDMEKVVEESEKQSPETTTGTVVLKMFRHPLRS